MRPTAGDALSALSGAAGDCGSTIRPVATVTVDAASRPQRIIV